MRGSTVRGAAIDINDFEKRLRGAEPPRDPDKNPLTELARVIQGPEHSQTAHRYDQMFAAEAPPAQRSRPPVEDTRDLFVDNSLAAEMRGGIHEDHAQGRPGLRAVQGAAHSHANVAGAPHEREMTYAGADFNANPYSSRPAPQAHPADDHRDWDDAQSAYLEDDGANPDHEAPPRGHAKRLRPWHAVAAIAVVAASGLGWGFAQRSGVMGKREIATIAAPDGPAKVPPAAEEGASIDKPDAAVLDRNESAPVKRVVSHQEQAIEPQVQPRSVENGVDRADADGGAAPLVGQQPKKIKTVSVRADGSVIPNAYVPPAIAKAAGAGTHETAKHVSTTPASPVKPTATPRLEKTAKPKAAVKVASAKDDAGAKTPPAHQGEKGGFAVQFGAATTEAEARALANKVASKYGAQLGGHRPTFKMAKVGDKTVYRVRVGGMSKESAAGVCSNVKASGGNCFTAGN